MKKTVFACLMMLALVGVRATAQTNENATSEKKWAVINITDPVKVGRQVLMGTYLVVHDDAKMAKGEPCTTIYRFDAKAGPKERIVAFMCVPKKILAGGTMTLTVITDPVLLIHALQGFEFANDSELHGVPTDAR